MRVVRALVDAGFIDEPETEPVPTSASASASAAAGGGATRTRFVMSSILSLLSSALSREEAAAITAGDILAPPAAAIAAAASAAAAAAVSGEGEGEEQGLDALLEQQRTLDLAAAEHATALSTAAAAIAAAAAGPNDPTPVVAAAAAGAAAGRSSLEMLPPVIATVLSALPTASLTRLAASVTASAAAAAARRSHRATAAARPAAATEAECWFCLSNPRAATHLVVAVGNAAYIAMPRGPVTPQHAMVLPVAHVPCLAAADAALQSEAARLIDALGKMHREAGRDTVVFERYIRTRATHHMQVQVVGIPREHAHTLPQKVEFAMEDRGLVRVPWDGSDASLQSALAAAAAQDAAAGEGVLPQYVLWRFPSSHSTEAGGQSQLWYVSTAARDRERGRERDAALVAATGVSAPTVSAVGLLDLPRAVVAEAAGVPEKSDWKVCVEDEAGEKEGAERLKKEFAPYDPTEENDDDDSDDE